MILVKYLQYFAYKERQMSYKQPRILVIEDNDEISQMEYKLLTHLEYEVKLAYSGTEALLLLEQNKFEIGRASCRERVYVLV